VSRATDLGQSGDSLELKRVRLKAGTVVEDMRPAYDNLIVEICDEEGRTVVLVDAPSAAIEEVLDV
jgi:hypothetical protein